MKQTILSIQNFFEKYAAIAICHSSKDRLLHYMDKKQQTAIGGLKLYARLPSVLNSMIKETAHELTCS
jgi:hypothetical protein